MAIQVLNLSIYSQAFIPIETHQTIGYFNEINSIMEYVAEIMLHHKNAFPENGNSNPNDLQMHKHGPVDLYAGVEKITLRYTKQENCIPAHFFSNNYHYLFCKEINPPPPKA